MGGPVVSAHMDTRLEVPGETHWDDVWGGGEATEGPAGEVILDSMALEWAFFPKKHLSITLHISLPEAGTQRT